MHRCAARASILYGHLPYNLVSFRIPKSKGSFLLMPALVVPNGVLVRLLWNIGATTTINVLGATAAGGTVVNQALANALGTAIKAAVTSSGLISHLSGTCALNQVGVRDVRSANNAEFLDSGANVVGTAVGDQLPGGVALVITLRTARAGQSYRGRVYLGGFTETDNNATGGAATALGTAGTAFVVAIQSAMNANGLTLSVMSRPAPAIDYQTTIHNADGTTTIKQHHRNARPGGVTPVTAVLLRNTVWDSQRRRTAPGSVSTLFMPVVQTDLATGETWGTAVGTPLA